MNNKQSKQTVEMKFCEEKHSKRHTKRSEQNERTNETVIIFLIILCKYNIIRKEKRTSRAEQANGTKLMN